MRWKSEEEFFHTDLEGAEEVLDDWEELDLKSDKELAFEEGLRWADEELDAAMTEIDE